MSDIPAGLIGVPAVEWMWTTSALSLLHVASRMPDGSCLQFRTHGCTLARKRNELAEIVVRDGRLQWLLLLDSDMAPPPDIVQRLWATDADMASGVAVARSRPDHIVGYRTIHRGAPRDPLRPQTSDPDYRAVGIRPDALGAVHVPIPIDTCGGSCLLIRRRVLEAIEPPWFVASEDDTGEDSNFTLRATLGGFRLVLDPRTVVGHVWPHAYGPADALRALSSAGLSVPEPDAWLESRAFNKTGPDA